MLFLLNALILVTPISFFRVYHKATVQSHSSLEKQFQLYLNAQVDTTEALFPMQSHSEFTHTATSLPHSCLAQSTPQQCPALHESRCHSFDSITCSNTTMTTMTHTRQLLLPYLCISDKQPESDRGTASREKEANELKKRVWICFLFYIKTA